MLRNQININRISVIIPVKNNQKGIENLLESFFKTQKKEAYPLEIIVVDNNSNTAIEIPINYQSIGTQIHLIKCLKNGPAAARNAGAKNAKGEWLYFTDSDCLFTETTLEGYLSAKEGGIAYAGKVIPLEQNMISNYYKSINLLNPPPNEQNNNQPNHIITANCLVRKSAFENVNGFNEDFMFASGEDVDLGLRLSKIGNLYFASQSTILHDFQDNIIQFYKRFYRYGKSIQRLENSHNIKISIENILPKPHFGISFFLRILLKIAIKKGRKTPC